MSTLIQIADAVVHDLVVGSFAEPLAQAERTWLPTIDIKEAGTLHVQVAPNPVKGIEIGPADRNSNEYQYRIYVALQQRFEKPSREEIDAKVALLEEVADFWRRRRIAGLNVICQKVEVMPVFAPEHLEQNHQYSGILLLHFFTIR